MVGSRGAAHQTDAPGLAREVAQARADLDVVFTEKPAANLELLIRASNQYPVVTA